MCRGAAVPGDMAVLWSEAGGCLNVFGAGFGSQKAGTACGSGKGVECLGQSGAFGGAARRCQGLPAGVWWRSPSGARLPQHPRPRRRTERRAAVPGRGAIGGWQDEPGPRCPPRGRARLPGLAGRCRGALAARSCAPRHASCGRGHRSARAGGGQRCPARIPRLPPKTPQKHPHRGPCSQRRGSPPRTEPAPAGRGRGSRSPLPPLTLFGWTEGCLRESFSTLFHIHNGLNIGEQSGTWRAKPSPWSEPMTSPPR